MTTNDTAFQPLAEPEVDGFKPIPPARRSAPRRLSMTVIDYSSDGLGLKPNKAFKQVVQERGFTYVQIGTTDLYGDETFVVRPIPSPPVREYGGVKTTYSEHNSWNFKGRFMNDKIMDLGLHEDDEFAVTWDSDRQWFVARKNGES